MSPLLEKLADQFNAASKGKTGFVPVKIITASPSDMVAAALKPDPLFQAMSPDSSIWLSKLNNEWAAAFAQRDGAATRYPADSAPALFAAPALRGLADRDRHVGKDRPGHGLAG